MIRLRPLLSRLWRHNSGAAAATIAVTIPLFLIAAAATFDMGVAYIVRNQLQITADSAALAGASALPDTANARTRASAAAVANMASATNGNVLVNGDIFTGNWNATTRVFTANGAPLNAVRVITRRAAANSNPVTTTLAGIFGLTTFNISTSAVAVNGGGGLDDCLRNGFLADGLLEVGSVVTIQGETCVHGQEGIKVGSNVVIQGSGADVTYGVGSTFEGRGNSGNSIPAASQEDKVFPADIDAILDAFLSSPSAAPQPGWGPWDLYGDGTGPISGDWKPNSTQCTALNGSKALIIVTGKADLTECNSLNKWAVYAENEIILPSGSSPPNQFLMQDMYFASNKSIEVGSNVDIGGSNYCMDGLGSTFFIARNFIKFQSDIKMWGVQIISGASGPTSIGVELGDDIQTQATAVWSAGYLKLGSNPNLNGGTESESCEQDEHILTHSGNMALRLVD